MSGPDVLLLDEPTNHLDDSAVAYLGEILTGWEGPILLSSHDRAFLDETATKLIDMDPSPLPHSFSSGLLEEGTGTGIGTTQFSGNFSDYVLARTEARDRWQRQYHAEQDELGRLRAAAKQQTVGHAGRPPRTEAKAAQKFYADRNARAISRRLNDAKGKLAQLEAEQIRKPPADLTFTGLPAAGKSKRAVGTGPALVATEVGVAGRLEPVSFSVGWGEHWLITGPNGSGKSTLAAVLAGDLTPSHGNIFRAGGTRIAMLSQEV